MYVINARNVNDAYDQGLIHLLKEGEVQDTRAGQVIVLPYPLTTVYEKPTERVLFDPVRDANPFFHLFESLWMLSGRNDATWLDQFVSDFSARFAEDDGMQHGAYGYRWRNHFYSDQLPVLIRILRTNNNDRRAVLTMWDPASDLGVQDKKDIPCNSQAFLRVRKESSGPVLDITVCCRSNDAIWGAYGANAVHFSVLLEYLARMIGVGVGKYYQVSNNFHAYTEIIDKLIANGGRQIFVQPYESEGYTPTPLIHRSLAFDSDLADFMEWTKLPGGPLPFLRNTWFEETAAPLFTINRLWKAKHRLEAWDKLVGSKISPDWKRAAQEWMERRMKPEERAAPINGEANKRQIGGQHYKTAYEHWDLVLQLNLGYFEGNATKYLSRWRKKGGKDDLQKAMHYVDKLIESVEFVAPPRASMNEAAVAQQVVSFAQANKLWKEEEDIVFQLATWSVVADLIEVRGLMDRLLLLDPDAEEPEDPEEQEPRPVPISDSNKHAERA